MKMDERQYEAVHAIGTDILVSASAGAGKTRVLVERLIKRCIEDRVGMNEILAVTFTEAAASEMKNRVAKGLQDKANEVKDPETLAWIRSQMVLLSTADITTIDSFCLNIIRKYYSVIGLDPATVANVMDESARRALLDEAFHQALVHQYETNYDALLNLLETTSPRSEDYDTLKTMVYALLTMSEQYSDSEQWLRDAASQYDGIRHLDDLPDPVKQAFFAQLRLSYDRICRQMERMMRIGAENEKVMKKYDSLLMTQNRLLSCRQPLEENNYDLFREMFLSFGADQATPSGGKEDEAYADARDLFYKVCGSLTEILYDSDVFLSDIRELAPACHLLADLALDTSEAFQNAKKENACMDFGDMERFAWQILQANGGEVAEQYRSRLKEVMVDEFQDTSLLQDDIITALSAPGTIFRVGDVKQSIYRFRGARPALMRSLMSSPDIRCITLDHNYRSLEKIIRFSNVLFSRIMNVEGISDSYGENDVVSPGVPGQIKPDSEPIHLVLIHKPEEDEEETGEEAAERKESTRDKKRKAIWIANKMIELHNRGYQWKDFAVLVRSHAEKFTLSEIFSAASIPADIDTREGFYNSDLCRYMLALFQYLLDESDSLSLLTVLTGELVSLSDEELADLRLSCGSIAEGVRERYPQLHSWFRRLRRMSHSGMVGLLDEIACHEQFYEKLSGNSRANFDFLYEKVCALASDLTLPGLITMMKIGADERSSNASCRSKDDDIVTVTTIHQSKGLQYKVVFLWCTGNNPLMDSRSEMISDTSIPFGLKHYDLPQHTSRPTIFRIAAAYTQNIADIEEFSRVLYVALTRAEESMYLIDFEQAYQEYCDDLSLSDLVRRKGITGLIGMALKEEPGLFTISIVPDEPLETADTKLETFVPQLPHYSGDYVIPPSLLRPSEHLFFTLPALSAHADENGSRYGTMIHETIASLPDRPWTKADFSASGLRPHDIEALLQFSASDLYQKALTMDIRKELPFYANDPSGNARMNGIMDFVAVSESEILLIDFKTDALSPQEIKERYTPQLNHYRRALNLLYPGIPVTAYAWSFHNGCAVEINA